MSEQTIVFNFERSDNFNNFVNFGKFNNFVNFDNFFILSARAQLAAFA